MLRNFILLKVQIFNYQLWKVVLVKQRAIEYEKLILHYLIANLIVKHESLFLLTTAQKRSSIHYETFKNLFQTEYRVHIGRKG
jgi:hypothetical protein